MANTYSDQTGVLKFSGKAIVTDVIKTLFAEFNLRPDPAHEDQMFIHAASEGDNVTWENIVANLYRYADGLALEYATDDHESFLLALNSYFGSDISELATQISNEICDGSEADAFDLFELAMAFQDGHNLQSVRMQGCYHTDCMMQGGFGGWGQYVSSNIRISSGSCSASDLGLKVDQAVRNGRPEAIASAITEQVKYLISALSPEVQAKVRDLLTVYPELGFVQSIPVLSTGHVDEQTRDWLDSCLGENYVAPYQNGWFINTNLLTDYIVTTHPALKPIRDWANKFMFHWIRFDSCGDCIEELPQFDW